MLKAVEAVKSANGKLRENKLVKGTHNGTFSRALLDDRDIRHYDARDHGRLGLKRHWARTLSRVNTYDKRKSVLEGRGRVR